MNCWTNNSKSDNGDTKNVSINKRLYRWVLLLIKVSPLIIAAITLLNSILSILGIDTAMLPYIGGYSLMALLMLYLSSFVFNFGISHRLFIHYLVIAAIISLLDIYIGIPVSDKAFLCLHLIIAGVIVAIAIFFRNKGISRDRDGRTQKALFKYELSMIRIIPMISAGFYLVRTILGCFGIDLYVMSLLGGQSLVMIIFMYLSSIAFRFCVYHRVFIHYILATSILNVIDWYSDAFVLSNIRLSVLIIFILSGITIFVAVYFKLKEIKKQR